MLSPSKTLCAAATAGALLFAGCGGDDNDTTGSGGPTVTTTEKVSDATGARTVAITLDDGACDPQDITTPAGPTTFVVTGAGTEDDKEIYFLDGVNVLGEIEQIDPGQTGKITLNLKGGDFDLSCNNPGLEPNGSLTVTGSDRDAETLSAQEKVAADKYRDYLVAQTALLTGRTEKFAAAVKAGNVEKAKALYGPARVPYERIEPVAESLGDLDPKIDARNGDVPAKEHTGFHVIEQQLWTKDSTTGMAPFATKLVKDVKTLQTFVKTVDIDPVKTANGAVELLNEVSKSKITGEEERFSRIDLLDFQANVEGAETAYDVVRPILEESDAALAKTVKARFADMFDTLADYEQNGDFVLYDTLKKSDKTTLSRTLDALAEPLSEVPAKVVG